MKKKSSSNLSHNITKQTFSSMRYRYEGLSVDKKGSLIQVTSNDLITVWCEYDDEIWRIAVSEKKFRNYSLVIHAA